MKTEHTEQFYTVLLYPPHGVPRVVTVPYAPGMEKLVQVFGERQHAEAALEKFLTENPEYRRWRDGRIQPAPSHSEAGEKGGT